MMQLITSNYSSGAGYSPWIAPPTPLKDAVVPLQSSRAQGEAAEESDSDIIDREQKEEERKLCKRQYDRFYRKRKAEEAATKVAVCVICESQSSSRWYAKNTTCNKCYQAVLKAERVIEEARKGTICAKGKECCSLINERVIKRWTTDSITGLSICRLCYEAALKAKRVIEEARKGSICAKGDNCRSLISKREIKEWNTDAQTGLSICSSCYYHFRRHSEVSLGQDIKAAPTKRIRHLPLAQNPDWQPFDMSRIQPILPANDAFFTDSAPLIGPTSPLTVEESGFDISSPNDRLYRKRKEKEAKKIVACLICGTQNSGRWYANNTTCNRCYKIARKVQRVEEETRMGTICAKGDNCRSLISKREIKEWSTDAQTGLSICSSCYYHFRRHPEVSSGQDIKAAPTKRIRHLPRAIERSRLQPILPPNEATIAENVPLIGPIRPLTIEDFL